jgi:hypothetical protein
MKCTAPLTLALSIAVAACSVAATVHIRTADGTWVEVEAAEANGAVKFDVTPAHAPDGSTLVVVDKPDWMVLEDETPPHVSSYSIGEGTWEMETGEGFAWERGPVRLVGIGDQDWTRLVTFHVVDDANPLDTTSALLRIDGRPPLPLRLETDVGRHSASFTADLNAFGPGAWEGVLEVADLAPTRNAFTMPLRFAIPGLQIAEDQQSVNFSAAGAGFTVRGGRSDTISVDASGISAHMTLQPGGQKHLYVRGFESVTDLGTENGWREVEAKALLEDIDGKPVTDEEVGVRLYLNAAVHNDLPAIVVTGTVENIGAERSMYGFWGWLPGAAYVTPDGDTHEWTMTYHDFGNPGWVFLPNKSADRPGVGWISGETFGESRFGTMLLYTTERKPAVATGDSLTMTFALMPALAAEEVEEMAERLREKGVDLAP